MKILFSDKHIYFRKMVFVLVILAGLLAQGCLEFKEELSLNEDGSGTLRVKCIFGESATKMVELLESAKEPAAGTATGKGWFPFTQEGLEERFQGDGIKIESSQFEKKDMRLHVGYTVKFDKLQNLLNTKSFQDQQVSFYRDKDDNLAFQLVTDTTRRNLATEMMATQIKEELTMDFVLALPTKVLEKNADTAEGNNLTWHYTAEKQEPEVLTAVCAGTGLPFLANLPIAPKKIAAGGYVYDPTGKPDPFRPFILEVKRPKEIIAKPLQPLQRYEISQLTLVGVIWQTENPRAIFEDATGKGYIVSKGSYVGKNEGTVTEIFEDEVVITEKAVDILGETKIRDIRVRLHEKEAKSK